MLTTGEGGAVFTDDSGLADQMRALRDHGAVRSDEQRKQTHQGGSMKPQFPAEGYNFRMTEMQGAIGVVQAGRLRLVIERRREIAQAYDKALSTIPWLKSPPGSDEPGRVLTFYPVQVWSLPGEDGNKPPTIDNLPLLVEWKEKVIQKMGSMGVGVRPPMISIPHDTGLLESSHDEDYPGTRILSSLTFALPIYPTLSESDVKQCIESLIQINNDALP